MKVDGPVRTTGGAGVLEQMVTDSFAGLAGSASYPCLGARSVTHRDAYTVRMYPRLGSEEAAAPLARDLAVFGAEVDAESLSSFVAVFEEPTALTEDRFHELLWRQLQLLHRADRPRFAWDDRVSASPDDPHFSFSVGGVAYFVIGLHAGSSR